MRRRFGLPPGYGRDPYRRHLKATAPYSNDPRQLSIDFRAKRERRARPAPAPWPWPWSEPEPDIEEVIRALEEKPT
jgi:hypothetical protein